MNVFQLLECIKMNMVEERMVALGFNNENPKKYIHVPSIQQPHG
jgi:hypothetical protein